jgi:hypothetical protein
VERTCWVFPAELQGPKSLMVFTTPSGMGAAAWTADSLSESPHAARIAMDTMEALKNAFFILFSFYNFPIEF